MAKEKAEKVEAEVNEFIALNEGDRLDAILKVRKAFEELDTYPDRIEANARRVRLLELWNKLIHMRGTDLMSINVQTVDTDAQGPDEAQVKVGFEAEAQADVDEEAEVEAQAQAQAQVEVEQFAEPDEQSNEVQPTISTELLNVADDDAQKNGQTASFAEQSEKLQKPTEQFFPELLHHIEVEKLAEEDLPSDHSVSADGLIGPMPQKHPHPPHDIELERVRLKLIKTGMLHDTVLPAGTIIAVIPVDAQHILESGMADYATASD